MSLVSFIFFLLIILTLLFRVYLHGNSLLRRHVTSKEDGRTHNLLHLPLRVLVSLRWEGRLRLHIYNHWLWLLVHDTKGLRVLHCLAFACKTEARGLAFDYVCLSILIDEHLLLWLHHCEFRLATRWLLEHTWLLSNHIVSSMSLTLIIIAHLVSWN